MTSEIRTNSLKSRAGLSTVTLTDSGPMFSGITTFVDNSGFNIGTGSSIFSPATNTLTLGTNSAERLRITENGVLKLTGQSTSLETAGLTHHTNNNLYIRGGTTGVVLQSVDGNESWVVQNDYVSASTSGSERLRISSAGLVGIGTDNPTKKLEVFDTTQGVIRIRGGAGGSNSSRKADLSLFASGAREYVVRADASDAAFKIVDVSGSNAERLTIASDGVITAQKSATFGNTSDSFTAVQITSSTSGISELRFADTTANPGYIKYTHSDDVMEFVSGTNNQLYLYGSSKEARFRGYVVAQSAGSGGSTTASFGATQSGMSASSYNYILSGSNDVGNRCVMFVNGSSRSTDGGTNALTLRNDGGNLNLGNSATNTIIHGTVSFPQSIDQQQTKFRHTNSGGVGAYLSLFNLSTTAGSSTGISFGIGNSDAQLDGADWGEGQIKVYSDSGGYGNMEFNCHTNANRSWLKIVGNGQGFNGASAGTEGMRGGVAFGNAGIAIDRSWTGQPGIHVFNQNVEGDTDQGTFRFHGWNRSYASYPNNSGSDFGVTLVADGMTLTSDRRRKTGITTITDALNTVSQMRGVSYTYVNEELQPQTHMSMDNGRKLGFIAQEVIPLLPQLIHDSGEKAVQLENGYCDRYNMDYGGVTPLLVEAIKELITKVETLEQENIALRVRVNVLEDN